MLKLGQGGEVKSRSVVVCTGVRAQRLFVEGEMDYWGKGLSYSAISHAPFFSGRKVAVIGGGPAGLSAAYQLALKGHSVTIFDDHDKLGGMMRYGIPGYRTPREVLDAEIQRILNLGIETRLNCKVGVDVTIDEIRKEFDAVFLGLGAQGGRALPAEGAENTPNVVTATAFLKAFNDGRLQTVGRRVVVVGGGDTSLLQGTRIPRPLLGPIDLGDDTHMLGFALVVFLVTAFAVARIKT
ncbi:MAG: FAD-dependent oxidoreductase, partial [Rhodocyclaceae bacterium]|nr:FAD-dependent oxidoreductase [Rhodocyclaceae bacterium]